MKKATRLLLPLLALLLTITGCSAVNPLEMAAVTQAPGDRTQLPAAVEELPARRPEEAQLWFRYGEEPLLAPEERTLTWSASEPYERALTQALLDGPAASSGLRALFPPGTRAVSTLRQGRLLLVTLSEEIWHGYADEPEAWQADPYWQEEVPLRRALALQSLAATITSNCDIDTVQVLVTQRDASTGSMRLPKSWLMQGEGLTGPVSRDERLLLSPGVALDTLLRAWKERDWQRAARYIAEAPALAELTAEAERLPMLAAYSIQGGDVRPNGTEAVFSVTLTLAQEAILTDEFITVHMTRAGSIWKLPWELLLTAGGLL